jgi:hypothetical protein
MQPGQYAAVMPNVSTVDLDPVKSVYVESTEQTDVTEVEFE